MAKELRWEHLFVNGQGGDGSALAEFRNDSASMIHIRTLNAHHNIKDVSGNDQARTELSKAPTMAGITNNNVFYAFVQEHCSGGAGAVTDGSISNHAMDKYARGQLTLEPGESLYVNHDLEVGALVVDIGYTIGYEF